MLYIPKTEKGWKSRYNDYVTIKKLINKSYLTFPEYKKQTLKMFHEQKEYLILFPFLQS